MRHKTLDAVGDLALAGAPILGCYRSYRGGHQLNVAVLEGAVRRPQRLRGRRGSAPRSRAHADMAAIAAAAAYAPDLTLSLS